MATPVITVVIGSAAVSDTSLYTASVVDQAVYEITAFDTALYDIVLSDIQMLCTYKGCNQRGLKIYKGYCCKAHHKLATKPQPKVVPCAGCGAPQRRNLSAIAKSGKVYCSRCKRPKGESHYKWTEGSYIDNAGYRVILLDGVYKREHRIVWQEVNRASLLCKGTIHHVRIDLPHNKLHNDPDNLLLVSDEEHGRFHRLYEAERYEEAFQVLRTAASKQLHYPKEIDNLYAIVASIENNG